MMILAAAAYESLLAIAVVVANLKADKAQKLILNDVHSFSLCYCQLSIQLYLCQVRFVLPHLLFYFKSVTKRHCFIEVSKTKLQREP